MLHALILCSRCSWRWRVRSPPRGASGMMAPPPAPPALMHNVGLSGINMMRQQCAYHPASGGAVEREKGTLKNKLAKRCEDTGIPWTKALPIVLTQVRAGVRARSNLSPFDILLGRPMNTGIGPEKRPHPSTGLCEDEMLRYCKNLSSALPSINQLV